MPPSPLHRARRFVPPDGVAPPPVVVPALPAHKHRRMVQESNLSGGRRFSGFQQTTHFAVLAVSVFVLLLHKCWCALTFFSLIRASWASLSAAMAFSSSSWSLCISRSCLCRRSSSNLQYHASQRGCIQESRNRPLTLDLTISFAFCQLSIILSHFPRR